jgi:hypothetical protein
MAETCMLGEEQVKRDVSSSSAHGQHKLVLTQHIVEVIAHVIER